jgi:hypothetical protein
LKKRLIRWINQLPKAVALIDLKGRIADRIKAAQAHAPDGRLNCGNQILAVIGAIDEIGRVAADLLEQPICARRS